MINKEQDPFCQITGLPQLPEKATPFEHVRQMFLRIRWTIIRRWKLLIGNLFLKSKTTPSTANKIKLVKGDIVRVKTIKEIKATLNSRDELKGCSFMEEMEAYCGTTQRVFKRIDKFMDERDYRVKRTKNIVFLENAFCQGTKNFGECDRSCFFFWRVEWLEKVDMDGNLIKE
ncbi:MAG: hypothetical protein P4L50_14725 [Anaerolineaceae bacterium]|nr:hypothetical protein [Anaerolineaceae bacterium]